MFLVVSLFVWRFVCVALLAVGDPPVANLSVAWFTVGDPLAPNDSGIVGDG